jgi:prepilin-type N-terminal cleavage/methylation domain-containing protein
MKDINNGVKTMTRNKKGFTLIEILLVVVIIGIMLAVIVPRAWRANVDAKYGLVRQNATELVSFAHKWAEQGIQASPPGSLSDVADYFDTLCFPNNARVWVGNNGVNNWNSNGANAAIAHRGGYNVALVPESSVQDLVAPEKIPLNPFNGTSVFANTNDPVLQGGAIPGAIAGGLDYTGGNWHYYALIFLGTESDYSGTIGNPSAFNFHGGMAWGSLEGLRNGIFMAQATAMPSTP